MDLLVRLEEMTAQVTMLIGECEPIEVGTDKHRSQLSAMMQGSYIETANVIASLMAQGKYHTALLLVRPLYESFFKAKWLAYCATHKQYLYYQDHDELIRNEFLEKSIFRRDLNTKRITDAKAKIYMKEIVGDVVSARSYEENTNAFQRKAWRMMNQTTHAGINVCVVSPDVIKEQPEDVLAPYIGLVCSVIQIVLGSTLMDLRTSNQSTDGLKAVDAAFANLTNFDRFFTEEFGRITGQDLDYDELVAQSCK